MKSSTLHIKVSPAFAQGLRRIARKRSVPVGELVRQAMAGAYLAELSEMPERQRRAVYAYQGGFISIGKLAEVMGMSVWEIQAWLNEHDVAQNSAFTESDSANA